MVQKIKLKSLVKRTDNKTLLKTFNKRFLRDHELLTNPQKGREGKKYIIKVIKEPRLI